jgi:hypothetical protein
VVDELGIALVALAGVADLYLAESELQKASDLATFVLSHHVSWRETKQKAQAIVDGLNASDSGKLNIEPGSGSSELDVLGALNRSISDLEQSN